MSKALECRADLQPFSAMPGPKGHPILGQLRQIKAQPVHRYVYDLAQQYGGLARFRVLNKSMCVVSDPQSVQALLKARPDQIRRASKIESVFKEIGVHGVFSAEGQDWARQRTLMNPAFKPSQIKAFFPLLQKYTEQLCGQIAERPFALDIQSLLMQFTVNVTSSLSFGMDLTELQTRDADFQRHLNSLFPMLTYRLHAPFPYWKVFKLQRDRDLDASLKYVRQLVSQLVQEAKQRLQDRAGCSEEVQADNLLESMLMARDAAGQSFTEDELFANVITLLLAGEDTTANTLAWAIHYLADLPELQDRVYAEIDQNYPEAGGLRYADMDNFPLTFACAQEAMRLVPVAPYLLLESYQSCDIAGYQVPKGTMIFALLATNGFSPGVFSDTESFVPERWLTMSEVEKKRHASELMHFGFGARLCPGRQLSFVEMKIALIELLRRYRFRRTDGTSVTETLAFTVYPRGLRVEVEAR